MRNGVTLRYGDTARFYFETRQGIARLREDLDKGYVVKAYGTESGQMVAHLVFLGSGTVCGQPCIPGF